MKQDGRLKSSINFLMWSYFNLTLDDGDKIDRILGLCIRKAYSDATQQGAYNTLIPKDAGERKAASQRAKIDAGEELLHRIRSLCKNKGTAFDAWHGETCNAVKENYAAVNGETAEFFSYGNAQKWVNMALKYLYTLYWLYREFSPECRFCKEYGEAIETYAEEFHVPVDSFMIEAIGMKNASAWSKWTDEEYDRFRGLLNEKIPSGQGPLDWEGCAWISVAKKRKRKDFQTLDETYQ